MKKATNLIPELKPAKVKNTINPTDITRDLAVRKLQDAGYEVHAEKKVILYSQRVYGLKMLRFKDCLCNRHGFHVLSETATESYLAARRHEEMLAKKKAKKAAQKAKENTDG